MKARVRRPEGVRGLGSSDLCINNHLISRRHPFVPYMGVTYLCIYIYIYGHILNIYMFAKPSSMGVTYLCVYIYIYIYIYIYMGTY